MSYPSVIIFEETAFFKLIDEIERRRLAGKGMKQHNVAENDVFISENEVMTLFGIKNKGYFGRFRSKNALPCSKVGKKYLYRRLEIEKFIENRSTITINSPLRKPKRR